MRPSASLRKEVIKTTPHQSTSDKWGVPTKGQQFSSDALLCLSPSLPLSHACMHAEIVILTMATYDTSAMPCNKSHFLSQPTTSRFWGAEMKTTGQPLISTIKKTCFNSLIPTVHSTPLISPTSVKIIQPVILLFQQRLPLYATFALTAVMDVKLRHRH